MMTITVRALHRFRELVDDGECIRLYLSAGGCNPSVALDIVRDPGKDDIRHEQHDFIFYLENEISGVLREISIDYADRTGFIISGMPKTFCCSQGEDR